MISRADESVVKYSLNKSCFGEESHQSELVMLHTASNKLRLIIATGASWIFTGDCRKAGIYIISSCNT